jgi:hypothetical protein
MVWLYSAKSIKKQMMINNHTVNQILEAIHLQCKLVWIIIVEFVVIKLVNKMAICGFMSLRSKKCVLMYAKKNQLKNKMIYIKLVMKIHKLIMILYMILV